MPIHFHLYAIIFASLFIFLIYSISCALVDSNGGGDGRGFGGGCCFFSPTVFVSFIFRSTYFLRQFVRFLAYHSTNRKMYLVCSTAWVPTPCWFHMYSLALFTLISCDTSITSIWAEREKKSSRVVSTASNICMIGVLLKLNANNCSALSSHHI